jgi:hypothetical protein
MLFYRLANNNQTDQGDGTEVCRWRDQRWRDCATCSCIIELYDNKRAVPHFRGFFPAPHLRVK